MGTTFSNVVRTCNFPVVLTPREFTQVKNHKAASPALMAITGFLLRIGKNTLIALTKAIAIAAMATQTEIQ